MLQIGRTLHDTDEYLLTMTGQSTGQQTTSLPGNRNMYRNFRENVINQLKHRILTFLYRRAVTLSEFDGNLFELRKFYQFFDQVTITSYSVVTGASKKLSWRVCPRANSKKTFYGRNLQIFVKS